MLTGHVHDPFDLEHRVNGRTVRLIGAGTLSERLREHPPSFNEIRIRGRAFETIARVMDEAHPDREGAETPITAEDTPHELPESREA